MIWSGSTKRRRHSEVEGAMSFPAAELKEAFGRGGFERINKDLGLFRRSANWHWRQDARGATKAYWFTQKVEDALDVYLRRRWRKDVRLMWLSGATMKAAERVPAAIASTSTEGKPVDKTQWEEAKALNLVRVDLEALKKLRAYLRDILDIYRVGRVPDDLITRFPGPEVIERWWRFTAKIIRYAMTDIGGHGAILHRYWIAPSGRLFARGVNLQGAPGMVKEAALHGMWDYDFANCHYAILSQMAAKFGYTTGAVNHYIDNKEPVRRELSEAAGITRKELKDCLLMVLYGARQSTRDEDSIAGRIGAEAALKLYAQPLFVALKKDIEGARRAILRGWPRRGGRLVNDSGKAIQDRGVPPPEKLAHLTQGAEAKALLVAFNLHPNQIVLLQHDGFTSTARLDPERIQQEVLAQTGYSLRLEETRLRLDPHQRFMNYRPKKLNRPETRASA